MEKITGSLKRQGILKFRYRLLKTSETDHRMFVVNFSIRFLIETSKNIAIDGRKCLFKVVYSISVYCFTCVAEF